jgi:hypothetical protein
MQSLYILHVSLYTPPLSLIRMKTVGNSRKRTYEIENEIG